MPRSAIGALCRPAPRRAGGGRARARRPPVHRATPSPSCAAAATSWCGRAAPPRCWPGGSAGRSRSIYGGGPIGAVAAVRWKCQVNENAKAPAFANRLPELCHNEVAGWGQHGDVTRQVLTLVQLRHDFEHPQVGRRFELVDDLVDEVVGAIHDVQAEGDGPLAQLFDLVLHGRLRVAAPGRAGRRGPRAHPRPRLHQGRSHGRA